MRALVTGSAGFLGRHFTRHLRDTGWLVREADISSGSDARECFASRDASRYDLVIHCAAQGAHRKAIDTFPASLAVNFELDAALFRWALQARPGRIVYISSSAAYPVALQTADTHRPLAESDVWLPGGPQGIRDLTGTPDGIYGWAKLTGELLAAHAREAGLAVSVVRPFSGYGSDQSEDFPFAAFTDRALRREDPFDIWGSGGQVRDFIYVDDIVAAVMAMSELHIDGPVNLASGVPVSMRELAREICAQAGYSPEIRTVPSAPSGVSWRVADITRMAAVRMPSVSLAEGIAGALDYRKRFLR